MGAECLELIDKFFLMLRQPWRLYQIIWEVIDLVFYSQSTSTVITVWYIVTELGGRVKVEVAAMGSMSPVNVMVSVDVKQYWNEKKEDRDTTV